MEYTIYTGTILKIKNGFLKGHSQIMYCGMCNQETYVLSPLTGIGYQGYSPSIYFNLHSTRIQVLDRTFDVIEVTPEYIILGD